MTKNSVDSIKTLSQRVMKSLSAQGKTFANYPVSIRVDKDSPEVLKVFGAFSPAERSIIIQQVFNALQNEIRDIIMVKCSFKRDSFRRQGTNEWKRLDRNRKRKILLQKQRRQQAKAQAAEQTSD